MLPRFLKHSTNFFSTFGQNTVKDIKSKATSMAGLSYKIRPLKEEDIPGVVAITKANRFQFPISGLRSWMQFDPEGILVAVHETGKVMGVCCGVRNHPKFFFGGVFCVSEEFRNLEIGHKLFSECFVHALSGNVGCNCTSDLLNSYKRRGIGIFESNWSSLEYETYDVVNHELLEDNLPEGVELRPYHDTLFPAITAYDKTIAGFDRTEILDLSFHEDDCFHLVALKGRTCIGFGSIKLNIQGIVRVGPLYAEEPCIAETMLRRLIVGMKHVKGLAMVTFSNNLPANEFLRKLGMVVQDNSLRVYTKERLQYDTSRIYAQFDVDFSPF